MGRMSLIIVFSVIVITGMTFVSIREINNNATENSAEYAKETEENFDCNTLVEKLLNDYVENGNVNAQMEMGGAQGHIEPINISSTFMDTIRIVAHSESNRVEAVVSIVDNNFSLPDIPSPITCYSDSFNVQVKDSVLIDGGDSNPGIAINGAMDNHILDSLNASSHAHLRGNPQIDDSYEFSNDYIETFMKSYGGVNGWDRKFSGNNSELSQGDINIDPYHENAIFSDGNLKLAAYEENGSSGKISGSGILVVNGELDASNREFIWDGIIVANSLNLGPNDSISGGVLLGGGEDGGISFSGLKMEGEKEYRESGEYNVKETDIQGDRVIPESKYRANIDVIGGGYGNFNNRIHTLVDGQITNEVVEDNLGDLNNHNPSWNSYDDGEMEYYEEGTSLSIQGWVSRTYDDHGEGTDPITVSPHENDANLMVLKAGDEIPGWEGVGDQQSVNTYLENAGFTTSGGDDDDDDGSNQYVDIASNQAIYLFEWDDEWIWRDIDGDGDAEKIHNDYQDLIVLATFNTVEEVPGETNFKPVKIIYDQNNLDAVRNAFNNRFSPNVIITGIQWKEW